MSPDKEKKEMVGYRQQPGKLPFSKPGSGGSSRFSLSLIHISEPTRPY